MFGGIFSRKDIDIFLTKEEINQLVSQTIKGRILKHDKPTIQFPLSLSIFEEIGVYVVSGNKYRIFLSKEYYKMLKENRCFETRYDGPNHKIMLADETYANKDDDLRVELQILREKFENPMKFI